MAGDVPGGAGSPSDRQVSPRAAAAAEAAVNNARKRLDFEDESGMVPAVSAASAAALLAGKDSVVCEDSPERPAFSYARLTAMAIDASPDKRCTVAAIYTWIMDRFPYYRQGKPWWKVRGGRRETTWKAMEKKGFVLCFFSSRSFLSFFLLRSCTCYYCT